MSRISGKSEVHKLEIELDVNTEIYPMQKSQYYAIVLSNSLTADGAEDFDLFRHTNSSAAQGADTNMQSTGTNLIDQYDYVMHGKIFEDQIIEAPGDKDSHNLSVFISFGGLLMSIKGKFKDLKELEMDSRIYLCLKQIG